jgi:protein-S-isoprenylcysteine O-methyltransferase Ste14
MTMETVSVASRSGAAWRPGVAVALDWLERAAVAVLYAWLVSRIVTGYLAEGTAVNLLLLPSEGLVVLLILIRRTTQDVSRRPVDWLLASAATTAPLLVYPGAARALIPPIVAAVPLVMGIVVQLHAKIVLGRSMGCVPANRGLKFAGPYRFVRHPMYLGYLLSHLAFLLLNPTVWNLGVYLLCYSLQVPRLLVEEKLLRQDASYAEYMAAVRWRLVPGLF